MMRLTIVREDNVVLIDGEGKPVDCSSLNAEIKAVQWNSDTARGHIEYVNADASSNFKVNTPITSANDYQPLIDAWHAYEPPPRPPLQFFPVISDRQFFQALAMQGKITQDEALAAVSTGAIPAELKEFVDKLTDPQELFAVRMLLSGATQFDRHHPLVAQMAYAFGLNDDEIDELWRFAATL